MTEDKLIRESKRNYEEVRPVTLERGVMRHAEGSCLVKFGHTHVMCTASLEEKVPPFLRGKRKGWLTAEYGMLPRSTNERMRREAGIGRQSGRTMEIQRLIGRSLRAICDLTHLGERQIVIDCDVLQADGGTRTAAITGAYIALNDCVRALAIREQISAPIIKDQVAAISCGIVEGQILVDLDYGEDSNAQTDANFVMTGSGQIVEIQASAEGVPFASEQFSAMMEQAKKGIDHLIMLQKMAMG